MYKEVASLCGAWTTEEQRLVLAVVLRRNLHGVEDTMAFVFGGRSQDYLTVAGELQVNILAAHVGEGEASDFGAAVFENRHLCKRLDIVVDTLELDDVAGKAHVVLFGHNIQGCVGGAPDLVTFQVANIQVCTIVVGADFPVSVEHNAFETRESAAAVVEQHRVLTVAQHAYLRNIGNGVEIASVALCLHFGVFITLVLSYFEVDVRFNLSFLFQ